MWQNITGITLHDGIILKWARYNPATREVWIYWQGSGDFANNSMVISNIPTQYRISVSDYFAGNGQVSVTDITSKAILILVHKDGYIRINYTTASGTSYNPCGEIKYIL